MTERSPEQRRAQRVFSMVAELHKRGYQRLRVVPCLSGSGMHWRCWVTPASNILRTHGAHLANWDIDDRVMAGYSSGQDNEFFGWTDRKTSSARELADTFIERFPQVCADSRGADWAYAGWFVELLGIAERGWFPIVYADWRIDEEHGLELIYPGDQEPDEHKPSLPPPPPGEALDQWPEPGSQSTDDDA
jgi:hypothetical protein